MSTDPSEGMPKVRYAVVGLGYISQVAVLPAFGHAGSVAELAAFVSGDRDKATRLARRYEHVAVYDYDEYDACLASGIDAVYIALPNRLHAEYAIRAAKAGVHVLCEKPMASTVEECEAMIAAARDHHVKLMIAYRLHFEAGTLHAIELARSGRLGAVRLFSSVFTTPVEDPENIRLKRASGGGTLPDIGVYCINAARAIFRSEPAEVFALEARGDRERFRDVGMSTSALLRFPGDRLASFSCSFGAVDSSSYQIVGDEGELVVNPAFDFTGPIVHRLTRRGRSQSRRFPRRDQFAPELLYFSRCIREDFEPGPSGEEGLADVRVLEALRSSIELRQPVVLAPFDVAQRPDLGQELHRPPASRPRLYHASTPQGGN